MPGVYFNCGHFLGKSCTALSLAQSSRLKVSVFLLYVEVGHRPCLWVEYPLM